MFTRVSENLHRLLVRRAHVGQLEEECKMDENRHCDGDGKRYCVLGVFVGDGMWTPQPVDDEEQMLKEE